MRNGGRPGGRISGLGLSGLAMVAGACTPFLGPLPPDGGPDRPAHEGGAGGDAALGSDAQDGKASADGGAKPNDGGSPDASTCVASATPLRLISPLSTSFVTSLRPNLTWEGPSSCGTTIDLCSDPACAQGIGTISTAQAATSGRPTADLPSGVVFWRARSGDSVTGVWSFFVGKGTDVDSSGGTFSDFNGDGRSDVAVQADNGVVLVYYGAADGFQTPPTVLSIPDPARFAAGGDIASVGDVSGDGLADLVVAAPTTSGDTHIRLYTFLGKRDGIASSPSQTLDVDSFGSAIPKVRGGLDINADGYGDLLLSWAVGGAVPIVGGAGLQQGKEIAVIDGTIATGMIAVCDFNGDGIQDFVMLEIPAAGGGAIPIVFRGTGSAFVRDGATIPSHGTDDESFQSIACGDVQGDGYPEVIAGAPNSDVRGTGFGDVVVFENDKGMFHVPGKSVAGQEQLLQAYTGTALQMIGDMNADGVDDLAIGCGGEASVAQIAFQPLSSVPSDTLDIGGAPDTDGTFGSAFAGGDFDGDGLFDLVVGSSSHGNGRLTLFRGSRSARVLSPSTIHVDAPTGVTGFGQKVSTSR